MVLNMDVSENFVSWPLLSQNQSSVRDRIDILRRVYYSFPNPSMKEKTKNKPNKNIYFFVGTTAEFKKLAPIIKELKKRKTNLFYQNGL